MPLYPMPWPVASEFSSESFARRCATMVRCTVTPSEQLFLDQAAQRLAHKNLGDMRGFTSLLIATKLAGSHKIALTQHRADTACM